MEDSRLKDLEIIGEQIKPSDFMVKMVAHTMLSIRDYLRERKPNTPFEHWTVDDIITVSKRGLR